MENLSPSIADWQNLYNAAIEFKEIACWNWMYDSDLFGVQNPENGEMGYCCVLGNLGEVFALAAYLGTDGLEGYLKMQSGEVLSGDIQALHIQKCLMASFEDRKFLDKPDLQVIKELGLKFRGRHSWPLFRSYRPGYFPWYLTKGEASFLALALQQALEVAQRFKENEDFLTPPQDHLYLVRVPVEEGGTINWRNEWLEPPPLQEEEVKAEPIDEVRLERIKKAASRQQGIWEVDFFYAPTPVKEGGRPYYPRVFLWVDQRSNLILDTHLARPSEYRPEFPEKLLNLIENTHFLPQEILVEKEEAFHLLEPITRRLGVKLTLVRTLRVMESVRAAMFGALA